MDARDYPEAYLENELESYGTKNHALDRAAKKIRKLRSQLKIAKEALVYCATECLQAKHLVASAALAKLEE